MSSENHELVLLTIAYHSHAALHALSKDLVRQNDYPVKWVIVNNSPDSSGSINLDLPFPCCILRGKEGAGFAEGCNQGLDQLFEEDWNGWVWLLNPDIRIKENSMFSEMEFSLAQLPQNALVGTAVFDENKNLEKSAGWIDPGFNFRSRRITDKLLGCDKQIVSLDWISGCSMLLKPSAHFEKPRFESALPLYYEDMDFCLRLAQGGAPVIWLPFKSVSHQKGKGSIIAENRRLRLSSCSYIRFLQRHRPGYVLFFRTLRILLNAFFRLPISPIRSLSILKGCLDAYISPLV